jgi:hypothetical protein
MDTPDKLIAIAASFFADANGNNAHPGIKKLELLSSLADRRVKLGLKVTQDAGFITKQGGGHRTRTSVYSFHVPEKTLLELSERVHGGAPFNDEERVHRVHNDAPKERVHRVHRVHGGAPYAEKGSTNEHERVHGGAPLLNKNLLRVNNAHTRGESGKDFWAKTLNPSQAAAYEAITRDENGDIHVSNGARARLESILGGRVPLEIALSMVKGKISPEANGMWLQNRVESVLAEWVMEQDQRDKRAATAKGASTAVALDKPPDMPPRVFRNELRGRFKKGELSAEILHANGVKPGTERSYE